MYDEMTFERLLSDVLASGARLDTPVRVIDSGDGTWLRAIVGVTRVASGALLLVLGDALDRATDEEIAARDDTLGAP